MSREHYAYTTKVGAGDEADAVREKRRHAANTKTKQIKENKPKQRKNNINIKNITSTSKL